MKIYVASSYENKVFVRKIVRDLEDAGFEVTSTWHKENLSPNIQIHEMSAEELRDIALRDLKEIDKADAILVYTNKRCVKNRGGFWVEMGYALGRKKKVYLIGLRINAFTFIPVIVRCPTIRAFLRREKP